METLFAKGHTPRTKPARIRVFPSALRSQIQAQELTGLEAVFIRYRLRITTKGSMAWQKVSLISHRPADRGREPFRQSDILPAKVGASKLAENNQGAKASRPIFEQPGHGMQYLRPFVGRKCVEMSGAGALRLDTGYLDPRSLAHQFPEPCHAGPPARYELEDVR